MSIYLTTTLKNAIYKMNFHKFWVSGYEIIRSKTLERTWASSLQADSASSQQQLPHYRHFLNVFGMPSGYECVSVWIVIAYTLSVHAQYYDEFTQFYWKIFLLDFVPKRTHSFNPAPTLQNYSVLHPKNEFRNRFFRWSLLIDQRVRLPRCLLTHSLKLETQSRDYWDFFS